MTINKLFWRIRGHDGFKTTFEMRVEVGQLTRNQINHVLRTLAAKAGLSDTEIVGAYAKRKTTIANGLLDVHRDSKYPTYSCGGGAVFTASVVDEHGTITRNRTL